MREITELIIHCSATPEGRDYTTDDIDRWHRARGFKSIGYHYVIYRDGSIHTGRSLKEPGAHCTGHNQNSIGICYIGGCDLSGHPKDTRTPRQKEALHALLEALRKDYPDATIHGHNEFSSKACPSFRIADE